MGLFYEGVMASGGPRRMRIRNLTGGFYDARGILKTENHKNSIANATKRVPLRLKCIKCNFAWESDRTDWE